MWKKVESSNLSKVRYKKGTLEIKFKRGGQYKYSKVPKEEYQALLQADSKGKHFNQHIKGVYDFQKVPEGFLVKWKS